MGEKIVVFAPFLLMVAMNFVLVIICIIAFWNTRNLAFAILGVMAVLGLAFYISGPEFYKNSIFRISEIIGNSAGLIALCLSGSSMPEKRL